MSCDNQYSESLQVGILLALTGGFFDAYTYLCRGNVFANAQTGNMVMLGINLIEGNTDKIVKYLIPIIAFTVGVLISEYIRERFSESNKIHWRQAVLAIEMILLICVAFIPNDYISNIIISLICAMQFEGFKKFNGNAYATTMCTGNLRSGTERLILSIKKRDKEHLKVSLQYYFIIFIFCLGACIGAVFSLKIGTKAILIACIPLVLSLVIMGYKKWYGNID